NRSNHCGIGKRNRPVPLLIELTESAEIEGTELREQGVPLAAVKTVPPAEAVFLTMPHQLLPQLRRDCDHCPCSLSGGPGRSSGNQKSNLRPSYASATPGGRRRFVVS